MDRAVIFIAYWCAIGVDGTACIESTSVVGHVFTVRRRRGLDMRMSNGYSAFLHLRLIVYSRGV